MSSHPNSPAAHSPPHVLREYALLADGERGILVGPRGDFAWMCAPRWDSDAVFSELIGGGGAYAVTPDTTRFVWGGYYENGTLIWRSRWVTSTGVIECREALAFPGEPHRSVVLRRIVAVSGPARVQVMLGARAEFGRQKMTRRSVSEGTWTATTGPLRLRWQGAGNAKRHADGTLRATIEVAEGDHHDLVLEISDRPLPDRPTDADAAWAATELSWKRAVPKLAGTVADYDSRLSYAVLRGLTSAGGGMVAASTMALPERSGQNRNYDYRYAWIRDQCYAGQAVAASGAYPLLDDAVRFVAERVLADGPQVKPAYTVGGGRVPDERALPLQGYPGGTARVGNWVNKQFQLDVFGEALLLFAPRPRGGSAGQRTVAGRGDRRRFDQGASVRRRRRNLGTERHALDALPVDLCRRPACGRGGGTRWSGR